MYGRLRLSLVVFFLIRELQGVVFECDSRFAVRNRQVSSPTRSLVLRQLYLGKIDAEFYGFKYRR